MTIFSDFLEGNIFCFFYRIFFRFRSDSDGILVSRLDQNPGLHEKDIDLRFIFYSHINNIKQMALNSGI